jgi:hypothetical protein
MFREKRTTNLAQPSSEVAVMVGGGCDGMVYQLVADVSEMIWAPHKRRLRYLRTNRYDEYGRRVYQFSELRNGS